MNKTRRIIVCALLTTVSLALFAVELLIPPFPFCPGAKIGLANIVTLYMLANNETGEFWTLNWEPVCHPYQSYKCTQGLGYTIVENKTLDTLGTLRLFVPTGNDACEIWKLSVKNEGDKKRSYSVFTYSQIQFKFKWGFDSYGDTMYRGTRFDEGRNTFYMNKHPFIKPHNYLTAFMVADEKITGSEGCQNVFIGEYGTIASPEVVREGVSHNSIGSANATICSLRFDFELEAGENKDISMLLGAGECEDDSVKMAEKYLACQDEYFEATKKYYKDLYSKNHITTNDEHFDRLINFWGKHATHFGATWCRWGYNGYRDIVQHGFGVVSFKNARTKLNMTQMNLADEMGVSYQAVSNWERGNSMPDISKLPELCKILNISFEELVGEESQEVEITKRLMGNEDAIKRLLLQSIRK